MTYEDVRKDARKHPDPLIAFWFEQKRKRDEGGAMTWLCKCGMINGDYDTICKNCHVERDIAEDEGVDGLEQYYLEAMEGDEEL